MIRRIICIDEEKCTGCGLCASACHEGAIGMENGKARLLREDFCDGFGDCLPACPADAITFSEREAPAYDESAVIAAKSEKAGKLDSSLGNFPVQIKLLPPSAPYYAGADLLIAADCTAFAYASFNRDFMHGKVTMIGCPKLDGVDYAEKLTTIFKLNTIRSVTVARMTVPCCGGLSRAVETAVKNSGRSIPINIVTIATDGEIRR